ncbi:rhamnogalacturonan acetylesterase [Gracilimonas mengyeensis]|nr:GDSL-type esterase/lipase family protein [Gracilimonas mengyeensis]
MKFDFGTGEVAEGYTKVTSTTGYSEEQGYGFDYESEVLSVNRGGRDALRSDFITSYAPFFFSVKVPEGNYRVTVTFGDQQGTSRTTVKAESRRLMAKQIDTNTDAFITKSFLVNVYHPEIEGGGKVQLKDRELDKLDWDHKLTLEFSNHSPKITSIEIERAEQATTVYLAGNSTVTNQQNEPWASWGQMLPVFFKPDRVAISNQGSSGLTLKEFQSSNRLKNVLSHMKEGDYLFIQFAHNDQKEGWTHVEPFKGYQDQLRIFINEARKWGATPVLVTSMHRRRFDEQGQVVNTLGDYPEAMRQLAQEEELALIDLHTMSEVMYEALGVEGTRDLFVHYSAGTFPGQVNALNDNTHFSNYGAYQLSKCIVEGIKTQLPELAEELVDSLPDFNPAIPDSITQFDIPRTPIFDNRKPRGN